MWDMLKIQECHQLEELPNDLICPVCNLLMWNLLELCQDDLGQLKDEVVGAEFCCGAVVWEV